MRQFLVFVVWSGIMLCAPINLLFLGWALKRLMAEAPAYVTATVFVAFLVMVFGFAKWIDTLERQTQPQQTSR